MKRKWPKARPFDTRLAWLLALFALAVAGRAWLAENPQHNPWAPLDLREPRGWATGAKLASLRGDPQECQAVLERSEVGFTALPATGEGECRREDRLIPADLSLAPADPQMTCSVAAGLAIWLDQDVQPLARELLGSPVARIDQIGTYSCRRMYGSDSGRWSEHATGNAIDIAGFVLEDGSRISLLGDWGGDDAKAQFLRGVRDAACDSFGTVLSPDYNAAHADHFHFDQGRGVIGGACR
ncbi:extensin family protein [Aurantiacibacter aquimixticola]|uniref:Extensin n=1 Tax=Aurantiacibacter aquimixticola TaxID=1958945 RepID=A0A419RRH3_9SPHN|nr:extensin family protein [Aurantiacibacter aquimixticola]RJY08377.1 extensin [Aurantiacibacter aquimixticola]